MYFNMLFLNMFKNARAFALLVCLCFQPAAMLTAQVKNPDWKLTLDGEIKWYLLTHTGIMLVSTETGLHGIDPEKKQVIWTLEQLAGLPETSPMLFDDYPFVELQNVPRSEKQSKVSNFVKEFALTKEISRSVILEPYEGKILFDTENIEVEKVLGKKFFPDIGCIWFEGSIEKKRYIGMVDMATGQALWTKEKPTKEKKYAEEALEPWVDAQGQVIFSSKESTFRYDARTGEQLWVRPSGLNEHLAFFPPKESLLGKTHYFIFDESLVTCELATGKIEHIAGAGIGKNNSIFLRPASDGTVSAVQFLEHYDYAHAADEELILGLGGALNIFDYDGFKPKWEKVPYSSGYEIEDVIKMADGSWLLQLKNDNSALAINIINPDGTRRWKKDLPIGGGRFWFTKPVGNQILVMTSTMASIVDTNTGKFQLEKPVIIDPEKATLFDLAESRQCLVIFNDKELYEINYGNNTVRTLVKNTKFRGDEADKIPNRLEARPDGYLLVAPQNMLFVENNGTIRYNSYYNPPGMSDKMKRLVLSGVMVTAGALLETQNLINLNRFYTEGILTRRAYNHFLLTDFLRDNQALIGALAYGLMARRRSALYQPNSFQLVEASFDGGMTGLLKFDLLTGKELIQIPLGEKQPTYKLDKVIEGLYYFYNDREVHFYNLGR